MNILRRLFVFATVCTFISCGGDQVVDPDPPPEDKNDSPTATIKAPSDGSSFNLEDTVNFEGSASDPEDGSLSGSSLKWESDIEGQLGTGTSIEVSDLSEGVHDITLQAEDSDGATGEDRISIEIIDPVEQPSVDLGVKLPRPDLSPSDSIEIANGEAVVVSWSSTEDPNSCQASGDWSGNKASSGRDTTDALSGSATLTFVLSCENSAGSAVDTAEVVVGAPGEVHATSDRPDDTEEPHVKFFYVVAENDESRDLDLNGELEDNFRQFQNRFSSQTSDRKFKVDTFSNGYDITFVRINLSEYSNMQVAVAIQEELESRGLLSTDNQVIVIHYDSSIDNDACGGGAGHIAFLWQELCKLEEGSTVGHEVLHALNFVDEDAPNATDGHVTDHERDLMDPSALKDFIVDYNRDDYYNENGLPNGIKNLAESPFLTPIQ